MRRIRARALHAVWAPALGLAAVLLSSARATAHERKAAGPVTLTIGWGDEPAFAGLKNFVEVDVADSSGAPVADIAGALTVDVTFGDQHVTLPLTSAGRQPGKLRAWLIPTRPGIYTFHVSGTVKGQTVDTTSTCSDSTFACVIDPAAAQFPAKDPSAGQLAERISRTLPRADDAMRGASIARYVAIGAAALAGLALGVALAARKGRAGV